jgi:DNA-binding beta-propeller fold protein YncE
VQVFDVATKKLAHTIDLLGDKTELSPLPIGICIAPDGDRAWIACQRGEFVAVVDLSTFAMVDRLPIGMGPDGMAYARWIEDGSTALQRTDK